MDEIKNLTEVNANVKNVTPADEAVTENTVIQDVEFEHETNALSLDTASKGEVLNAKEDVIEAVSNTDSEKPEEAVPDEPIPEKIEPWFNKEKAYKEKVAPLMKKIIKICAMENIPFFFASCVKDDGEHSKYIKELVSPSTHQLNLSQDLFPDLIAITLGFNTIPPIKKTEFVFDVLEEDVSE